MKGNFQELTPQQQVQLARQVNAAGTQGVTQHPGMVAYAGSPMGGGGQASYYSLFPTSVVSNGSGAGAIPQQLLPSQYAALPQQYASASSQRSVVQGQQAYFMYPMQGISPQGAAAGSGGAGAGGVGGGSNATAMGYTAIKGGHNLQGSGLPQQQQGFAGYAVAQSQGVNPAVLSASSALNASAAGYPQLALSAANLQGLEGISPQQLITLAQHQAARQQQMQLHAQQQRQVQQQLLQQQQPQPQQQQIPSGINFPPGKMIHVAPGGQAYVQQQSPTVEPALPKHEARLELRGEYGLDPIFNGTNTNTQAWPTQVMEGEVPCLCVQAAKRLSPKSAGLPAPSTESIQSILTYGIDPDSVGLSLGESDLIYSTISGLPYDDPEHCIMDENHVPEYYKKVKPQVLSMKLFQSFSEETLFYIFYSLPADLLHIAAARFLYERNWKFNRRHKLWCKEAKESGSSSSSNSSALSSHGVGANSSGIQPSNGRVSHHEVPEQKTAWEIFDTSSWSVKRCVDKIFDPEEMVRYELIKDRMSKGAGKSKSRAPVPSTSTTKSPSSTTPVQSKKAATNAPTTSTPGEGPVSTSSGTDENISASS